jgi:hypothetical protein
MAIFWGGDFPVHRLYIIVADSCPRLVLLLGVSPAGVHWPRTSHHCRDGSTISMGKAKLPHFTHSAKPHDITASASRPFEPTWRLKIKAVVAVIQSLAKLASLLW